ncbi:MAG: hypothetical protein AAB263_00630, partial [Planctomycetota bacterium]
TVLDTPKLRAAISELLDAAAAKNPEFSAFFTGATQRGFSLADLQSVGAHEMGASLTLSSVAGSVQPCIGAWATVADPLWQRLLGLVQEQVDAKRVTRQDLVRDGRTIITLQHKNGIWAILREDSGLIWVQGLPGKDPEVIVNRLMGWYAGISKGATFVQRDSEAKVIGQSASDTLFEGIVNARAVIDVLEQHAPPQAKMMLPILDAMFGLDALGLAGIEAGVTQQQTTVCSSLQTTGRRQGLLHIADSAPKPVAAPAWIPADALSASQFNLDLPGLIDALRTAAAGNPMFKNQFTSMENAVPALAGGLSLQQIATAIGGTFWCVELPEPTDALLTGDDRKAFVFALADPAVVTRLLPLFNMAARGREVRFVTEQGAQGVRFAANPTMKSPELGVFIGAHQLVVGIGSNVASEVLAAIARGDGAWARTPYAERGLKQLPTQPLLHWSVEDSSSMLRRLPDALSHLLNTLSDSTDDAGLDKALDHLQAALPDGETLASTMAGPSTVATYDDAGVIRVIQIQNPAMDN